MVPSNYSAHLETSTVNGSVKNDLPALVQTNRQHQFSLDIGGGGPPVRVTTTDGGVHISKAA